MYTLDTPRQKFAFQKHALKSNISLRTTASWSLKRSVEFNVAVLNRKWIAAKRVTEFCEFEGEALNHYPPIFLVQWHTQRLS